MQSRPATLISSVLITCLALSQSPASACAVARGDSRPNREIDRQLTAALEKAGFTGRIESTLERRLGHRLNADLVKLGRMLWFDTVTGLANDNTCAGCHSPTHGFGDSQSISIGIQNNGVVGPHRLGPRNMRRAPMVVNSAFMPRLMWNTRFNALSGDPFDNRAGFQFPDPEGLSLSSQPHLLASQAFIPPTERTEVAGFDFEGDNNAIRSEVVRRLNFIPEYRRLFGEVFQAVRNGAPITFDMFGAAIAEFEFSLTFANAPIDQFARGDSEAMTTQEKRGALLFFGQGRCVACHSVGGQSNEMFSDFKNHVIGVPQIAPRLTNNFFDGPARNEDFGREQVTGSADDRYAFRTSPLRNVAVQPAFMHNGAFTRLEDAIRYHLDPRGSASGYTPASQGLPEDLRGPTGPIDPVLARLDPALSPPIRLTPEEFAQLLAFVRNGLLDRRIAPRYLRRLVPGVVPSGRPVLTFEFSDQTTDER